MTTEGRSERPSTPTPTRTVTEGYIEAFALCNGAYQGAIEDFDAAAGITGINADLHNLLAHAHMYNAPDQTNDEPEKSCESAEAALQHFNSSLDMDPLHQQANEGFQMLRSNLNNLGAERKTPAKTTKRRNRPERSGQAAPSGPTRREHEQVKTL